MSETLRDGCVLIVEDDVTLRTSLHRALTLEGYQVVTASSGVDALSVLQREGSRIQVIVLDIVMPEMGGLALLQHLINVHAFPVGVVGMSGYSEVLRNVDEFFELTNEVVLPQEILAKPFEFPQLREQVDIALHAAERKRQSHREEALGDVAVRLERLERRIEKFEGRIPGFLAQIGLDIVRTLIIGLAVLALLYLGLAGLLREVLGL